MFWGLGVFLAHFTMAADIFTFLNLSCSISSSKIPALYEIFESEIISRTKADIMDVFSLPKRRDLHEAVGRFKRVKCYIPAFHGLE